MVKRRTETESGSQSIKQLRGRQFCWISGLAQRPKGWGAEWWLHAAHLGSGDGVTQRDDDRRAVVLLSPLVHQLHVASVERLPRKRINGVLYPTVDSSHLLWVKRVFDEDCYDEDYLNWLFIGNLPEPQQPPSYWVEKMLNNQGIEL